MSLSQESFNRANDVSASCDKRRAVKRWRREIKRSLGVSPFKTKAKRSVMWCYNYKIIPMWLVKIVFKCIDLRSA